MYVSEICEIAAEISGRDGETLRPLCAAAEEELVARLREGVSVNDCEHVLITAAALIVCAAASGGSGYENFRVGSVSVKGSSPAASEGYRKQAEALMAPYIKDNGFYFAGVRGN